MIYSFTQKKKKVIEIRPKLTTNCIQNRCKNNEIMTVMKYNSGHRGQRYVYELVQFTYCFKLEPVKYM